MPTSKRQKSILVSKDLHNAHQWAQYVPKKGDVRIAPEDRETTKAQLMSDAPNLRMEGGIVKFHDCFWDMMRNPDANGGRNCFEANLEHYRTRNNPADRFIIAYLMRENGVPLQHAYIVNGSMLVDNSNGRYKFCPLEMYYELQKPVRWYEIAITDRTSPSNLRSIAMTLELEYATKGKRGLKDLVPRKDGVWDVAAASVTGL